MSAIQYRSAHIPLKIVNIGWKNILLADRGSAYFLRDDNNVEDHITTFLEFSVTSQLENTPAMISFIFYGTHQYWWFICWFNGIVMPTEEIKIGQIIKIPDQTQMENYLKRTFEKFGFRAASSVGTSTIANRIIRV